MVPQFSENKKVSSQGKNSIRRIKSFYYCLKWHLKAAKPRFSSLHKPTFKTTLWEAALETKHLLVEIPLQIKIFS